MKERRQQTRTSNLKPGHLWSNGWKTEDTQLISDYSLSYHKNKKQKAKVVPFVQVGSRKETIILSSFIHIPLLKEINPSCPHRIHHFKCIRCCFLSHILQREPVGDRRWIAAIAWIHWLDRHIRSSSTLSEVDHGIRAAQSYREIDSWRWEPWSVFLSAPLWFLILCWKQASAGDVQSRILRGRPPPVACSYPLANSASLHSVCRCHWRLPVVVTLDIHSKGFYATSEKRAWEELSFSPLRVRI